MTPAVTAARRAGIEHRVLEYPHDPSTTSYGREAADALGVDPQLVYKTLVASGVGRDAVVAVIPVLARLDLKALAAATGDKKLAMAEPAAAERITGYVVGGISPLGQRRRLPTVVDRSALEHPLVYVSAGRRGLELALDPRDLAALTDARIAAIAR